MSESPEEHKPPSLSRPEELVDRMIGEFRLLRRLGAGGMAEVYLAEQPSLGRVVAVKVLQPERVAGFDSSIVDRFEREAKAAGGLNHSNIVQIYQIGEDRGIHFIVQEYIQGNNLAQQIRRDGPPELHQGLQWMQQIAEALHAASEAGIVHRDIKPENIMLTRELAAKVTDFGLAQLSQQADQTNLTQTGATMGTPMYMSPEQILGQKVDHRSDQYSFGVTCYHMFAGHPPFSSANSVTVAVQHLQDTPAPLAGHRADLPLELCQTVHRMIAKRPGDRFQSTSELLAAMAPLHTLSINSSLRTSLGLRGWLKSFLPEWRLITAALLATAVAGGVAGTILTSSHLPPKVDPAGLEKKDNAAAQFAAAMLQPPNESAWLVVADYFPESDEARYAQLHLALLYLSRVPPDFERAKNAAEELIAWTESVPGDYRRLHALALVARAMISRRTNDRRSEDRYLSLLQQGNLISNDERTHLFDIAPRSLRNYWQRTQPAVRNGNSPRRP